MELVRRAGLRPGHRQHSEGHLRRQAATPHTAPIFWNQERQLLRGLLELAAISPQRGQITATSLLAVLKNQDKLMRFRKAHPQSPAFASLADLEPLDPADYAERISSLASKLADLATSTIEKVADDSGFRLQDVLDTRTLVSVVAPLQDGQMATLLSSLFVNQLLFRAYERFANPGGVPVLFVLDEAARLQDFVDFEAILSVAREARVAGLIALQDAAQFKDENQRSIIFSNSATLIYLPGTSSLSAKLLSDRLGQHPVQSTSVSVGPAASGWGNQTSRSTQTTMAPVLAQREISNLPFGPRAAVVHSSPLATALPRRSDGEPGVITRRNTPWSSHRVAAGSSRQAVSARPSRPSNEARRCPTTCGECRLSHRCSRSRGAVTASPGDRRPAPGDMRG